MTVPEFNELNSNTCREKYISSHYSDFYEYLCSTYPNITHSERLYWYYHNITTVPVCKHCGARVKYINFKSGYRDFCSASCMNADSSTKMSRKSTFEKRYGVSNPMQNSDVRKKQKDTVYERYGVTNAFQSEEIKNKSRQTCLDKYNVDHYMKASGSIDKLKMSNISKYGVEWNSQLESVKQSKKDKRDETNAKMNATVTAKFLASHPDIISMSSTSFVCRCPHLECNKCAAKQFEIPKVIYHSRRPAHIELCTTLMPIQADRIKDTNLELFVKQLLDSHSIAYIENDRTILNGKELDIYIPSHNLAIECNGCYWHSTIYKDSKYHYQKWKMCADKGIQLLTMWEDWIITAPNKVRNLILSKLGIYDVRIGARQCKTSKINYDAYNTILNDTHIQGSANSKIAYGLYYNDEIVSVMTFGKVRTTVMGKNDAEWELVRYASKAGYQVIGGASKLLNAFIKEYNPCSIVSYASHDISNGSVYENLGFSKVSETHSSYWYIESHSLKRYHRYNFTKYKLVQEGYDASKTESQIMNDRGFYKIYDSGQTKYILRRHTK